MRSDVLSSLELRVLAGAGLALSLATGVYCALHAVRSHYRYTRRFFLLTAAFAALEIPRAVVCLIHGEYTGKPEFSLHLCANACFSVAMSVMCFIWHDITSVTPRRMVSPTGALICVNSILAIVTVLVVIACVTSASVQSFLDSKYYAMYVLFDTAYGLVVVTCVILLGRRLHAALRHWEKGAGSGRLMSDRLVVIMVLAAVSFIARALMLLSVCITDSASRLRTLWWLLADSVARSVGAVLFAWFLSKRHRFEQTESTPDPEVDVRNTYVSSQARPGWSSFVSKPSSFSEFDAPMRISLLYPQQQQQQQQQPPPDLA